MNDKVLKKIDNISILFNELGFKSRIIPSEDSFSHILLLEHTLNKKRSIYKINIPLLEG